MTDAPATGRPTGSQTTARSAAAAWVAPGRARPARHAARLGTPGRAAGWRDVGGMALFHTVESADACVAGDRLAGARTRTRIFSFSFSPGRPRRGLPGDAGEARLAGGSGATPG